MRGYVVFHGTEDLSGSWLGEQHEFRALAIVLTNLFVLQIGSTAISYNFSTTEDVPVIHTNGPQ